jgi:hypothetical protein
MGWGDDSQDTDIEKMLEACLVGVDSDARDFIESLNDWYEKKGFLSDKQLAALTKFYENL